VSGDEAEDPRVGSREEIVDCAAVVDGEAMFRNGRRGAAYSDFEHGDTWLTCHKAQEKETRAQPSMMTHKIYLCSLCHQGSGSCCQFSFQD